MAVTLMKCTPVAVKIAMDASVIICTRNRASSLARTLASIEAARCPSGFSWELVVVDNGSTDNTGAVAAQFSSRLPLTLVSELKPGLSNARNRGVDVASGQYLIWTDDDVMVEPGWMFEYATAFRRWPEAAVFGGRILPVLEEPVCPWFAACKGELGYLLAERDFGNDAVELSISEDRLPFGANYVIRAIEQRNFPYDPELGVGPGRNRMGEESQVLRAILAGGAKGHYVPGAIVHHMIPPSRQTVSYIRSYYGAHGETVAISESREDGRHFSGLPLWLWRQLLTEAIAYVWARAFSAPQVWVPHLKKFAYMIGYGVGLRCRDEP